MSHAFVSRVWHQTAFISVKAFLVTSNKHIIYISKGINSRFYQKKCLSKKYSMWVEGWDKGLTMAYYTILHIKPFLMNIIV